MVFKTLAEVNAAVTACRRCPRLVAHREEVGRVKRRAYLDQVYWSRPVPAFGDEHARILVVGLAPGAHGANRTGRIFTGDRSGDYLYRALHEAGLANQASSTALDDGLALRGVYISSPVRCVPPDNKPASDEILVCKSFLANELQLLSDLKVVVALGAIGFNAYLSILQDQGSIASRTRYPFGHGALHSTHEGGPHLLGCYHPSQQNTSTGRLTTVMLREIFITARKLAYGC